MRSLFCMFTILLAPSLLYAQGQSGSQPQSNAPESSLPRQANVTIPAQDAKLLAQAKPSASLLMIEGMNHVLKEVPDEREKQIKSYTDPSLPVAPKLIAGINSFIKAIRK